MGILRTIRNTMGIMLLLVALLFAVGVIYALVQQRTYSIPKLSTAADGQQLGLFAPKTPDPNAPVGVAIEAISTPVKTGDTVSLIARTTPSATCKVVVDKYVNAPSQAALKDKVADGYGTVSWSWSIDPNAPVGARTATIICSYHGHSGVAQGNFSVKE